MKIIGILIIFTYLNYIHVYILNLLIYFLITFVCFVSTFCLIECYFIQAFTTDFRVHWAQHPLRPEFAESTYFLYKVS